MSRLIGVVVMMFGVTMVAVQLFNIFHNLPIFHAGFGIGAIAALIGGRWMQGERSDAY
jgi:hypothetical protein